MKAAGRVCGMAFDLVDGRAIARDVDSGDVGEALAIAAAVLRERPDWKLLEMHSRATPSGRMGSKMVFSVPEEKKRRRYRVSCVERYLCEMEVDAPNKKAARAAALENFWDTNEYMGSTDWKVEMVQ